MKRHHRSRKECTNLRPSVGFLERGSPKRSREALRKNSKLDLVAPALLRDRGFALQAAPRTPGSCWLFFYSRGPVPHLGVPFCLGVSFSSRGTPFGCAPCFFVFLSEPRLMVGFKGRPKAKPPIWGSHQENIEPTAWHEGACQRASGNNSSSNSNKTNVSIEVAMSLAFALFCSLVETADQRGRIIHRVVEQKRTSPTKRKFALKVCSRHGKLPLQAEGLARGLIVNASCCPPRPVRCRLP